MTFSFEDSSLIPASDFSAVTVAVTSVRAALPFFLPSVAFSAIA